MSVLRRRLALSVALLVLAAVAAAQQPAKPAAPAPATPPPSIADAWGGVLESAAPAEHPAVINPPRSGPREGGFTDFANHLYLETSTEYWHTTTDFSGLPTATGVINGPTSAVILPAGIPDSAVFQPSDNELYTLLTFGTRGWGSDRVNTDFSIRYLTDLTNVNPGSPAQNIINTYPGNRKFELNTGYLEINGKTGDGFFEGSTLRLGRQYTYGAELASFDGASFSRNRPKYSFSIFGGRRFTYFSDPLQRGIGGVDLVYRIGYSSLEYSGLFYVKGEHVFAYRRQMPRNWLLSSYVRMVGSHGTDFSVNGLWTPANGKTTLRAGFFQKLSNFDYFYDYTELARDQDPYNKLFRLYLGPRSTYSQFTIDADRQIVPRLRLGGSFWLRSLNDYAHDAGPFDTSFRDYSVNAQVFPVRKIETLLGFHERDLDRNNPLSPTSFDDLTATGETRVQDFTAEVGKSFVEGRVNVHAGGFIRRLNFQDQFFFVNDAQTKGWLADAGFRLDQHTRVSLDYSLDTDFYAWRPSIKNGQIFRLRLDWKY